MTPLDPSFDFFTSSLPELLAARARQDEDRPFLQMVDGPTRTYADVDHASRRWATVLQEHGVERGDVVLVMLPSSSTVIEVWAGLNWLGAAEASVHNDYRGPMLGHLLRVTRARTMVVHQDFVDRLNDLGGSLEALQTVIVVGEGATEIPGVRVVRAASELERAVVASTLTPPKYHEISTILFTSGTTGLSKGVLMPFSHLQASTEGSWPFDDLTPADSHYTVLPLYHLGGKFAIVTMLMTGGRVVLRERFSLSNFWRDIERYDCSMSSMIGTIANLLYRQPSQPDDADTPLSKLLMIPFIEDVRGFSQRFGVKVRTVYSQTEISSPIGSVGWEIGDPASCGRVRPGYVCRIVNEFDEEVPVGQPGELVVRSERPWAMMAGYLNMPDKTAEVWRNQWLHTGDALRCDAEGNYYFVDRMTDTMRRRGENVSSMEVETFVNDHPDVVATAAVPVASDLGEDDIMIVVELREGASLTERALHESLAARLPRFMVPRYITFVDELPRTPTQKILKHQLRAAGVVDATWDHDRDAQQRSAGAVGSV